MKPDDNPLPAFLNRNPKGTEPMTTATAKTKKQTGYRVKLTLFIPFDKRDTASTRKALYIVELFEDAKVIPETAPKDTEIEECTWNEVKRDVD